VGVQTNDLDNSESWYHDFFQCHRTWSLSTFSDLTLQRLPGIRRLSELVVGDVRVHLFERPGHPAVQPGTSITQFQHVCVAVDTPEDLTVFRERWIELFESGRYTYALPDEPTEIVVDADGVQSFYTYDVNGLEFEFTYVPPGDVDGA